jgi:putative redox protein
MRTIDISFTSEAGQRLAGALDLPARTPVAYALFAHCFTCSKRTKAATRIADELAHRGIAVLRFDFTGLGSSEGEFADTTFSSNVADLVSAAEFLRAEYAAPTLLIGHSLGGAAVLAAAGKIPEVRAVVTIGAPFAPSHVSHLFSSGIDEIQETGQAVVNIGGREFSIRRELVDDLAEQPQAERIAHLKRDLLVMHAPGDTFVGIENAAQIFQTAKHPKSFISLDKADHLLTDADDSRYAAEMIAAWSRRALGLSARHVEHGIDGADSPVTVQETREGKFAHVASTRGITWSADEPFDVGGDNTGPNPYELLLSGLGACTSMTLRLYAERKGWDIGPTKVRLRMDRVHVTDAGDAEYAGKQVDRITREITLDPGALGTLTDEQRDSLLKIANKCPVHRTLEPAILIETSLAESGSVA